MDVPMKKKIAKYPLLSLRVTKETDQKKRRLRELGVDVPALMKPEIDRIFDQALQALAKKRAG